MAQPFFIESGVLRRYNGTSKNEDIVIPDDVVEIADEAFAECNDITSVIIPKSVVKIGRYAFWLCKGLKAISLSSGVNFIGKYAFSGCSELESISVNENNRRYHSAGNCLIDTESKILIQGCKNSIIPRDGRVVEIGAGAFFGCNFSEIKVSEGITTIGYNAFGSCRELERTILPESLTTIENIAFDHCVKLENIRLPSSLKEIGDYAFAKCGKLRELTIPATVETIGDSAFCGCSEILLYGLRKDLIYHRNFDEIFFSPPDAIHFSLYRKPEDKRRCVLNWLEGKHRRNDDVREIKTYISRQKSNILAQIAAHGSVRALKALTTFVGTVKFSKAAFDAAIEATSGNENPKAMRRAIRAYWEKLSSSGLIKPIAKAPESMPNKK